MLPRVRELEHRFEHELVAVGVHAGKYTAERRTEAIAKACLRLGVEHPVVNDRQFRTWRAYAVRAWPTLAFVDPNGYLVASEAGELPVAPLARFVERLLESSAGTAATRRRPDLVRPPRDAEARELRFPGKLLARGDRLHVSDTGHHQVVELALEEDARGRVLRRIGSGAPGLADGPAQLASFREPQGLALGDGALFVADRGNHAIRRVDLDTGSVTTIAGTGELGGRMRPGPARETALRSPWDLWLAGSTLYVAMAGSHQIGKLDLESGGLRPHAGSGAESIDDGPLAEATLAQPSGLSGSGDRLYFADSEFSAVRWADLRDDGGVGTLVGTGLFDFGDRDGGGEEVRLQHPLAVAWHEGRIFVADSYNGKVKLVDPADRSCTTWPSNVSLPSAGERAPIPTGADAGSPRADAASGSRRPDAASGPWLDEPGGLSVDGDFLYVADTGNHRIVRLPLGGGPAEVVDLETDGPERRRTGRRSGLEIGGPADVLESQTPPR